MQHIVEIIGIPTSAASYAPGQEQAPAALRSAGLSDALRSRGIVVTDRYDDPPVYRWRPDRNDPRAQNLDATVEYVGHTRGRVAEALAAGHLPLVLGGNCTIQIGVVAAHLDLGQRVGLIYFDLHADLNVPGVVSEGALDWMGVAHMLDLSGARAELAGAGSQRPLLKPGEVALFGFDRTHASQFERDQIERLGLHKVVWQAIAADPKLEAERLLVEWGYGFDRFIVHLDVDVLNFLDTPLAEYYFARDAGLTLDQAAKALSVFARDPRFSALTVTEINPNHGAEDGSDIVRFIDAIAQALAVVKHPESSSMRSDEAV